MKNKYTINLLLMLLLCLNFVVPATMSYTEELAPYDIEGELPAVPIRPIIRQ